LATISRAKELVKEGNKLFTKREPLLSFWQTSAEQFYPERADFTNKFSLGQEFASHLMTGRPVMARRDLANSFSAMLRPRSRPWFHAITNNEDINNDTAARQWLDKASEAMRNIFNDPGSKFVRATKEGDNDFAAFGQCVITIEPNSELNGFLFRCHHLRDTVWCENANQDIDTVHRNWSLEARTLVNLFKDKKGANIASAVRKAAEKEPYKEIRCRHIILPWDAYDYNKAKNGGKRAPFVSLYVDCDNETILEEKPVQEVNYVIPRWVTVSGSQYAYSPASIVALPDARLIQQVTLTLLEAGQKAVDPPAVAYGHAIQGDVNLYAGGVTWIDAEYDERTGSPLQLLAGDKTGLSWGDKREEMIHAVIAEAFYLNQIQVPSPEGDMTATEFRGRVEEYIRRAMPLFEPMEVEYNGALCEKTFGQALKMGLFGSPFDMPPILRGREVKFRFESPLQVATERAKSQAFIETSQLLSMAVQLDPHIGTNVNVNKAFREAMLGVAPSDWQYTEEEAKQMREAAAQQAAIAQMAQQVAMGAQVAQGVGDATQSLQTAGLVGAPAGLG
jgi:hypothetical protein